MYGLVVEITIEKAEKYNEQNAARNWYGEEAKDDQPVDVQNENLRQPEVYVVKFMKVNKMFPSRHPDIDVDGVSMHRPAYVSKCE